VFRSDVLSPNGLDDRRYSQGVLSRAQELMADAAGADHAFFSTCGSSLSVKTAMLAAAGPGEKLLLSRNAHKSVVAAVVVNGVEPIWVHARFDPERHLAHPPEPDDVRRRLYRRLDTILGAGTRTGDAAPSGVLPPPSTCPPSGPRDGSPRR
jgi:arginine/lysine/ornithine decarboxylase